jgi:hypothetical protein
MWHHAVPLEPPFPTVELENVAIAAPSAHCQAASRRKTFSKDRGQTAACMEAPIAEDTQM